MKLRDGSETADARLDRLMQFDDCSRASPSANWWRPASPLPTRPVIEPLDQGRD